MFWLGLLLYIVLIYEPKRSRERTEELQTKADWNDLCNRQLDMNDKHHMQTMAILERWADTSRRTEAKVDVILTELVRTNPDLKSLVESLQGD